MEYKVIEAQWLQDLVTMVNGAIQDGWEPQGGIAYYAWEETYATGEKEKERKFIQAMTRPTIPKEQFLPPTF